jgi:hypothetical protein
MPSSTAPVRHASVGCALRQKADYEVLPAGQWHRKLGDARYVDLLAKQAIASASVPDRLDFGPVAALLRR